MGDPVTIIDGLGDFKDQLLASNNNNPWKSSIEKLSGNSLVIPMDETVRQFGMCLGLILGLKLHEGYIQQSNNNYFIEKHNHDNELAATYVLFYLSNNGDPGYINLFDKDAKIKRESGRIIVIPKNRVHSVDPISGENRFIRYVFTANRPINTDIDRNLLRNIRDRIKFSQI